MGETQKICTASRQQKRRVTEGIERDDGLGLIHAVSNTEILLSSLHKETLRTFASVTRPCMQVVWSH